MSDKVKCKNYINFKDNLTKFMNSENQFYNWGFIMIKLIGFQKYQLERFKSNCLS